MEESKKISICHLYPDLLNLYGDRGNILIMKKRLEWRGFDVEVTGNTCAQPLDWEAHDIYFIGGGQDFEQEVLLSDLEKGKSEAIRAAVEGGKVFLAICGGYQLLGKRYETWDGKKLDLIGAINVTTRGMRDRMVGDFAFKTPTGLTVVAFENHSGRTYLGDGVEPLGEVLAGNGNNGEDGTEGVRYKNVWCSYGHGPLLSKNPALCDEILRMAVLQKYADFAFEALDDELENAAGSYMSGRIVK